VALIALSEALGEHDVATHYRERAAEFKARFDADWWFEAEGLYADSMHSDNSLQFDGHWTVALPLQLGLATSDKAEGMFERLATGGWINEWGLVHTRGHEDRVWTLPTGLRAVAAFEHGHGELGLWLLKRIAVTTETGTLGTFKELIPEGLCFIQLWSAGLYLQGIVEGVFGLQPLAHRHELTIAPNLPAGWGSASMRGLLIGDHNLSLRISPDAVQIEHLDGSQLLTVRFANQETAVAVGQTVELRQEA
jgi:glycogen debranching enzyme